MKFEVTELSTEDRESYEDIMGDPEAAPFDMWVGAAFSALRIIQGDSSGEVFDEATTAAVLNVLYEKAPQTVRTLGDRFDAGQLY